MYDEFFPKARRSMRLSRRCVTIVDTEFHLKACEKAKRIASFDIFNLIVYRRED